MDKVVLMAVLPNKTKLYSVQGQPFEVNKNYALTELIGIGTYGTVCSAIEESTDTKVAIKKVSNVFFDLREGKRVLREMELMTTLKHPNIIHLHHFFRPSSKEGFKDIYLVMDLFDTDLHKIIKSRQKLTNEHHQYFMIQAFRGLHYLHEAKVMHRDLKPSNLLVNGDCALAICDFGMARDDGEEKSSDLTQYVVTRWYRPPEVLGMGPQQYTNAVDVWSLGLIFAELLVGKALLQGKNYISQLVMIVNLLGVPSEEDMDFLGPDARTFLLDCQTFQKPQPFSELFSMATPEAVDLLSKLIVFHPAKRLTAKQVIMHPYFEKFRDPSLEMGPDQPFVWNHHAGSADELREKLWNIIITHSPEVES